MMPYVRHSKHLEELPSLDMRQLRADGVLPKTNEGLAKSVLVKDRRISLSSTACNYGGRRYWLVCPSCFGRHIALYWYGIDWKCRKCTGLLYRSQSQDKQTHCAQTVSKLMSKLNDDGSRPKRMRLTTYERICDEIEYYEDLHDYYYFESIQPKLDRLVKKYHAQLKKL